MKDHANLVELDDIILTLEFWLSSKQNMNEVEPRRVSRALDALSEVYAMRIRGEVYRKTQTNQRLFDLDQSSYDGSWIVMRRGEFGSTTVGTFPSELHAGKIIMEMLDEVHGES